MASQYHIPSLFILPATAAAAIVVAAAVAIAVAIRWAGTGSGKDHVMGMTNQYAAPECVVFHFKDETARRVRLNPAMDTYSVALIALQMLFVQENPRTDFQVNKIISTNYLQIIYRSSTYHLQITHRSSTDHLLQIIPT